MLQHPGSVQERSVPAECPWEKVAFDASDDLIGTASARLARRVADLASRLQPPVQVEN
jgi:hypothetical protein